MERKLPIGVYKHTFTKNNKIRSYYVAVWYEDSIKHTKTFNINKYGEEEALRLASEARKQKEEIASIVHCKNEYIDAGDFYYLNVISPHDSYIETVLFDKEDYNTISQYNWHIQGDEIQLKHAYTRIKNKLIPMEKLLLNPIDSNIVYHKNKNALDNRKSNLYLHQTRNTNKSKKHKNNKSGKTGVHKQKYNDGFGWTALIGENGKTHRKIFSIKKYGDQKAFELACEQRDKWAKEFNNNNA